MAMGMGEHKGDTTSSTRDEAVDEPWGTLEELLLACAVGRHGATGWDSIAKELQNRTSKTANRKDNGVFTAQNCKRKYRDLKRRFEVSDGGDEEEEKKLLRVVDELRKIRVEELKREVERHDVSIVSLQSKVKRLEEEREKSLKSDADGAVDLRQESAGNAAGAGESDRKLPMYSPEKDDADVSAGGQAPDLSFNESNSTSRRIAAEERESKSEPEENPYDEPDPVRQNNKTEPGGNEGSVSSGSGRLGNGRRVAEKPSQPSRLGADVAELRESVSESKREGNKQQSSDVQSSANLSKMKRRRFTAGSGGRGDEAEAEEISPANKKFIVKSQPLIRFLENLRSHKHGSVFQRRLPSQETEKYKSMIRQHMDIETVQSKLDRGMYGHCHSKFYRDLLLIFTNALFFYRKSSAEHLAARELRKLVLDEISLRTRKPISQTLKPDLDPPTHLHHNPPEPIVKKPRSSSTVVVCRRRSSLQPPLKEDLIPSNTTSSINKKNKGEGSVEEDAVTKRENKKEIRQTDKAVAVSKKQGVANFLKRIKQNSSPSKDNEGNELGEEKREKTDNSKKMSSGKGKDGGGGAGGRKEEATTVVVTRRTSGRREAAREDKEAAKKVVGKNLKRKATALSTPENERTRGSRGGSGGGGGGEWSKKKPRR